LEEIDTRANEVKAFATANENANEEDAADRAFFTGLSFFDAAVGVVAGVSFIAVAVGTGGVGGVVLGAVGAGYLGAGGIEAYVGYREVTG
jgi:hypothetical protein